MARDITVDANNTDKSSIADNDRFPFVDSEANPDALKEVLFSIVKSTLKTYFDTLYATPGYVLTMECAAFSPVDGATYYVGKPAVAPQNAVADERRVYIPKAGTITRVDITMFNDGGTQGSAETSTMSLRVNNTTDNAVSAAITADAGVNSGTQFNITGLSIAVSVGDYLELKWVAPTWVTNPTNVRIYAQIFIE